ncbi:MAG: hypothetical protein ABSF82_03415 [Candidatus Bathyarchaeia archaeon]
MSDDRLRERIALITRYFWLDDLFKIGNELNLDYFRKYSSPWETNQYQAATEIARNIDDDKLIGLCKKYVPKYGLSLGGFHGKYYTASTTGELRLQDSWELIRKNVRKALSKWSDQSYGTLQALINKNGKAAYFDLLDEIEKVLGYEFTPSYLLPRLRPLNLVFKTGSNKYPEWTMPSEIIPVVEEEIHGFKRPSQPSHGKRSFSESLLKQLREFDSLGNGIVDARRNLNVVFERRFGTALLKQNEMATNDLRKPCSNEEEFNNRILTLALLIDGIEADRISKLVKSGTQGGSVNLLEKFLEEHVEQYDKTAIKNLRMTVTLRSKRYPVHKDDPQYLNALSYFGFTELPPDWQDLWETLLNRYLETLQSLISSIIRIQ